MSKRIAPTLHLAVESPFFMPGTKVKLRAELRALLRLAKVNWEAQVAIAEIARQARNTHQDELDGDQIGRMLENVNEALERALSRLDKVSK